MTNGTTPIPTPRFNQILGASAEIARAMHHSYIGVEHLFLAIIHDPHSVPSQVLAPFVNVADVETRLLDIMNSDLYKTPAPPPADVPDTHRDSPQ